MKYQITYKTLIHKDTISMVVEPKEAAVRIKSRLEQFGALEVEMKKV